LAKGAHVAGGALVFGGAFVLLAAAGGGFKAWAKAVETWWT
jgi:hypothetical protein